MIGDVIKEYPEMAQIIKRHFGENCFCRVGFKITTLETACILYGVDQSRLVQEFEGVKIERHEQKDGEEGGGLFGSGL